MQTVYFISGLGADKRVFSELDLPNINCVYIDWVNPDMNDTVVTYSHKLLPQIDTTQAVILVGVSFGGMLATELTKVIPNCQTILLSSAPSMNQIPLIYKWLTQLKLPDLVPFAAFKTMTPMTYFYFGVTAQRHKELLKTVMQDTDEAFFRWAIKAITHWRNTNLPKNLYYIHGTKDRILPKIPQDAITIDDGGHLMVLSHSVEVSLALLSIFERIKGRLD